MTKSSTVRTEANEDKVVSTTWQSVDGLRSRQETLGVAGAATATRTRPMEGSSSSTQSSPDGTSTVTETVILASGHTQTTSIFKDTSSVILQTSSLLSDAMGRTIQATNGRGHVTNHAHYMHGGQTSSVTQVSAAPGGGNLVTSTSYTLTPGSGRLVTTTLPDGTMQYQESNQLGQTTRQWGSQTNPVTFTYDAAGRRATLPTYRAPVGADAHTFPSLAGDTTTWVHDASGVLLEKVHADGNKTTYSYDIAGRLATRTWARGVVTSYGYTAGQLTSVDYSDDTPDVSTTYDRLGRQKSQSNGLAATGYEYDPANLALDTETITIDPDGSGPLPGLTRILDRSRDLLNRDSGFELKTESLNTENSAAYGYDASGRMSTITSPAGSFSYAYTPNSSLIATVTGPVHAVTNTWESNRNVLDVKVNKIPSTSTPISSFNYGVNAIGQRTGVQTTGTAFQSQPADWAWGYDALGQVTSADSLTNTFDRAYEYDLIGNRKRSADGALVTTGGATVYDANNLNQYSEIQIQQSSIVNPVHDPDGNATSYPLPVAPTTNATLAYDGENRLISVTTGTTTVTYAYDSQSRRVAGTEGSNTTIYLYDGWNCLAEFSTSDLQTFDLKTSYTWGLDLSDSLQGAGGVGGLLSVTRHQTQGIKHFYPTYDGNCNISEYLTGSGSIAAHYEYDPFGRTIVATGPNLEEFVFRFSTEPVDPATGLYYYGFRYYAPDTGRWLSRDPIGERGGINLYGMVGNSPINRWDFLGLATYFAIYYDNPAKDPDGSFKKAAETWKKNMESASGFDPACDMVILKGVKTENDFVTAWNEIKREAEARKATLPNDYKIAEGSVFVHGTEGNLEFVPDTGTSPTDGTLDSGEQKTLGGLPWDDLGFLTLNACNSGTGTCSTARNFTDAQGVTTRGEGGYAYFSESDTKYIQINSSSKEVYLRAFRRRLNGTWPWDTGYNDPINRPIERPTPPTSPR